jgi:hypothetical protein
MISGPLAASAASFLIKRAASSTAATAKAATTVAAAAETTATTSSTEAATTAGITTSSAWSRFKRVPMEYPMRFGMVLSIFKTSLSDLLVQKVIEKRSEIDWKRNAAFATFGCFYLGGVQYMLYVPVFGRIFPNAASFAAKPLREKLRDPKGLRALFGQVFLDQCVHHPLTYFPVFYITKELIMQEKPDVGRVLTEYRFNMKEDLIALWKIWLPSTIVRDQ